MQVQYYLSPAGSQKFDVRALEQRVQSLPGAFRLHSSKSPDELSYVIAASKGMARYVEAKLKMDPRTSLISQGMITLSPISISVYQDAPAAILSQVEEFVTFLLKAYACRVLSDEGDDWTERYATNPHALFVEEDQWT
jgi:hypothetical protein